MDIPKVLLGLFLGGFLLCAAQDCNSDELTRCRDDAVGILEGRGGGLTKQESDNNCRTVRSSLNCMLWQTSQCLDYEEQNNKSDIIMKSWKYLSAVCESFIFWWANPCFQREDLKRCETLLTTSRSLDSISCRAYINFRECVNAVIKRCEQDDTALLGVYLLDKGKEKAWRCPKDTDLNLISSEPLAADSPYGSVESCILSVASESRRCLDAFEKVQREALPVESKEEREKQICCAASEYRTCLENAIKEKCGDSSSQIVETLSSRAGGAIQSCRDSSMYQCSAAGKTSSVGGLVLLVIYLGTILLKSS